MNYEQNEAKSDSDKKSKHSDDHEEDKKDNLVSDKPSSPEKQEAAKDEHLQKAHPDVKND